MKKSFILILYLTFFIPCLLPPIEPFEGRLAELAPYLIRGAGLYPTVAFAVEVAPRISDREIIEKLARLEEGQKAIQQQINDLKESTHQQINDLKESTQQQIESTQQQITDLEESTNKRFDAVDKRFDDMNSRFDDLRWMLSIFITIALVILGFVLRMQWQMQRRQTQTETTLETQKDELSFLKTLIEKLLPPKGVL